MEAERGKIAQRKNPKALPIPSRFHKKLWTRGGAELEQPQKKAFSFLWDFFFCEPGFFSAPSRLCVRFVF